jgi:peptidoglycan/xylan/chitin deacetylase (PgdA/CDA1 family)/regulation of enolase protein 1 (concanavalin A-like superfamily)
MPRDSLSPLWVVACGVLVSSTACVQAATIVSDDFNACALDTNVWTLTDPVGGGAATLTGIGTADALLLLSVPAGPSHDVWTDGNNAVRVMQPATNGDFEIQARFQSQYSAGYQMQGLLVEQDDGRFLRFDSNFDGAKPFLFAATFNGGAVNIRKSQDVTLGGSVWLAIKRAGNQWTLSYSADGANWAAFTSFSDVFTVSRVGVFAGNFSDGVAPAFTSRVDYFLNTAAPFANEDGVPQVPPATLTANVVGPGTVNVSPQKAAYYCGETVTLTAQPSIGYIFQGWSGDLSGPSPRQTLAMSQSRTVTATFVTNGIPPVISQLRATPGTTSALIQWMTNIPADGSVHYGPTIAYELGAVSDAALSTSHALTVTGLTPNTTYHYQATSADSAGDTSSSSDQTFTTAALPATGIVSDDFNVCTLDPRWTVVDPLGGTTVGVVGIGGNDARLRIAIPAGKIHDLWTDNSAAVRVLQAAPNADFEVQAKFDSSLTANYQFQGIDIEQDSTHLVRFDVDYNGIATSLFAASISGTTPTVRLAKPIAGASPIWLDVKRAGDNWTLSYSTNGTTWNTVATFTFAMTVARAGPCAGTYAASGSPPAFTCLVDYFMNVAQPFAQEDGPPQTPPAALTTNVVGQGAVSVSPQQAAYYCGENVTLTATPSAGWTFQGWSGDLSGSNPQAALAMTQSRAVTATFVASPPPGIASDDFNACSLNPRWMIVDPLGGSAISTVGVGTNDARLRIDIPAGRSHDLWSDANESIRVLQAAPNTDFEVQAKFDSPLIANYQLQGIEIEQDLTHFLRFDVDFDGTRTSLFAATVSGTSATVRLQKTIASVTPIYLRVKRLGNAWTLTYSADGSAWNAAASFTYAMTVARVGPFAGTYAETGSAPAFTCLVDYFMNTAGPFASEDGTPADPGATLTTGVNGQGSLLVTPTRPVYYCGETITITAQAAAGWDFARWGGDASGSTNPLQLAMTANRNITAIFVPADSDVPAIAPMANDAAAPGVPYTRTPALTQGKPPITWTLLAGPSGMTIDSASGTVSWANPQPSGGVSHVHIQAANAFGAAQAAWDVAVVTVQILDQNLSVQSARDGQVVRAGYKLASSASAPVELRAQMIGPGGRVLDDPFRNIAFTVTSTPQWFYRDLLVNLAPGEGPAWYGLQWGAQWVGGATAWHAEPGYLQVQSPLPVRVPILMYHYVGQPIDEYWVAPEAFRAQMAALKAYGYTSVTLTDVMDYRAGAATPPAKPIVITFDDGDGSLYTQAFPILADPTIDVEATAFVITSYVNTTDSETTYVTWDQLTAMEASGHMDVQSHTVSHPHLPTLAPADLQNELAASRTELQTRLSKEIRFISWPYGESNLNTQNAARDNGYFATLAASGGVNSDCAAKYDLLRTKISSACSVDYDAQHPADFFMTTIQDPEVVVPQLTIDSVTFLDPSTGQPLSAGQLTPGNSVKIRVVATNTGPAAQVVVSLALDSDTDHTAVRYDSHQASPSEDVSISFAPGQHTFDWTWQAPLSAPSGQYYYEAVFHDAKYVLSYLSSRWQAGFTVKAGGPAA